MNGVKYVPISRIGQGAYGVVVKARSVEDGRTVAIKQILLKRDHKSLVDVYREINALRNADHENIIELRDVVFGSNDVALVFDYVETNLKIVILDLHRPRTDNLTRFFFTQLLRGIEHLHELNIMHRDLKPENILIRSNGTLQIADFGLACLYLPQDKERTYSHEVATRWYRSPELLFGATRYTPTVDIWAFGCILAEYLNNSPLFEGSNDIEQIGRIFNVLGTPTESSWPQWRELPDSTKVHFDSQSAVNEWSDIVAIDDTQLLDLLQLVLQLNPAARPSAHDCLRHQFFSTPVELPIDYKPAEPESVDRECELVYRLDLDANFISNDSDLNF
ncbi:Cyclin-dependent kinase 20 [Aphelenchoides besseyi]|nr:Cyclin-dependent kinase 20 [Aphelenchoides besseyi]